MVLKKSLFNKKNTEEEKDEIKDKMIEQNMGQQTQNSGVSKDITIKKSKEKPILHLRLSKKTQQNTKMKTQTYDYQQFIEIFMVIASSILLSWLCSCYLFLFIQTFEVIQLSYSRTIDQHVILEGIQSIIKSSMKPTAHLIVIFLPLLTLSTTNYTVVSWNSSLLSETALTYESSVLADFFPVQTEKGTYNISFFSRQVSHIRLTVADGSKSYFTKMLTIKINFPQNNFENELQGLSTEHELVNSSIEIELVRNSKQKSVTPQLINSTLSYNITWNTNKSLTLVSSDFKVNLTLKSTTLQQFEENYAKSAAMTGFFFLFLLVLLLYSRPLVQKKGLRLYPFTIMIIVNCKTYIFDLSPVKGEHQILILRWSIIYYIIGVTLPIVAVYILFKSSLTFRKKFMYIFYALLLCYSLEIQFVIMFTSFNLYILNQDHEPNIKDSEQNTIFSFLFILSVYSIFSLKQQADSIPLPLTVPFDWEQIQGSYRSCEISKESVVQ